LKCKPKLLRASNNIFQTHEKNSQLRRFAVTIHNSAAGHHCLGRFTSMLHPVKSRGLVEGTEFSITVRNCELGLSPVYHHGVFRARFGIIIQAEMRFQDPGPFAKDLVRGICPVSLAAVSHLLYHVALNVMFNSTFNFRVTLLVELCCNSLIRTSVHIPKVGHAPPGRNVSFE
jgi:hypothetical protein